MCDEIPTPINPFSSEEEEEEKEQGRRRGVGAGEAPFLTAPQVKPPPTGCVCELRVRVRAHPATAGAGARGRSRPVLVSSQRPHWFHWSPSRRRFAPTSAPLTDRCSFFSLPSIRPPTCCSMRARAHARPDLRTCALARVNFTIHRGACVRACWGLARVRQRERAGRPSAY